MQRALLVFLAMLARLSDLMQTHGKGWHVGVMLLTLPLAPKLLFSKTHAALESLTGVAVFIDLHFFYSPERLFSIMTAYGAEGRSIYRTFLLTSDLVFPAFYALFLSLLLTWLLKHGLAAGSSWQTLNVLPLGGWLFDWLENICLAILLTFYPTQPPGLAWWAVTMTMSKWIFAAAGLASVVIGVSLALNSVVGKKLRRRSPKSGKK
jgi:hypothetical protein